MIVEKRKLYFLFLCFLFSFIFRLIGLRWPMPIITKHEYAFLATMEVMSGPAV